MIFNKCPVSPHSDTYRDSPSQSAVVATSVISWALRTVFTARTWAVPWRQVPGIPTGSQWRWRTIRLTIPYLRVQSIKAAVRTRRMRSLAVAIQRLIVRARTMIIRFISVRATGLKWSGIWVTVLPWRGGWLRTPIPRTETSHGTEMLLSLVELKNLTAIFHVAKQLNRVINSLCVKSICKCSLFNSSWPSGIAKMGHF